MKNAPQNLEVKLERIVATIIRTHEKQFEAGSPAFIVGGKYRGQIELTVDYMDGEPFSKRRITVAEFFEDLALHCEYREQHAAMLDAIEAGVIEARKVAKKCNDEYDREEAKKKAWRESPAGKDERRRLEAVLARIGTKFHGPTGSEKSSSPDGREHKPT